MSTSAVSRRGLLLGGATLAVAAVTFGTRRSVGETLGPFEIEMTEAEWRARLTPDQFAVLRQHGTERPFTSPLNEMYDAGTFACAGCALPLYSSETKYDSYTGWPSFWEALPDAIGTSTDTALMMVRTECHCARCGGHLGHIFDDGPAPTGKRHCINGVALDFIPA